MITAEIHDAGGAGREILLQTPFSARDICRGLPGRRWDAMRRAWTLPATPAAAQAVLAAFPDVDGVELRTLAARGNHAARLRDAGEEIPQIPLTNSPAWLHQRRAFWMLAHAFGDDAFLLQRKKKNEQAFTS